jgi:tetratricopeptide (TPR) repeat protein
MPLRLLLLACLLCIATGRAEESAAPADAYQETFVLYKTGKSAEALESVQKILKAQPKDAKALELQGRILHALGKYDAAVESYLAALEADPGRLECHYLLGEASFAQQYWAEAIQFYGVHLQKTQSPRAALKLVYCFVATGDLSQAGKLVSMMDPSSSEGPEYYFAKAAMDVAIGKEDQSQAALQQARTLYGNATFIQFEPDFLFLKKSIKPEAAKEEKSAAPSEAKSAKP